MDTVIVTSVSTALGSGCSLRVAEADDLPILQEIERKSGEAFRGIGMHLVADDEPLSLATLGDYVEQGRAWVIAEYDDSPVAYLLADVVDGSGHIEQVSVSPSHARRGLGRRLIDHSCSWARTIGLPAVTLTTFKDVAWNAPYYERCGFHMLSPHQVTPGLLSLRHQEAEHGLDAWPRVCMRRKIDGEGSDDSRAGGMLQAREGGVLRGRFLVAAHVVGDGLEG